MVQIALDGGVEMMNPMAVNLLLQVSDGCDLDNLFEALRPLAPQLPALCAAVTGSFGLVCEGLRLPLLAHLPTPAKPPLPTPRSAGAPEVLSLSVMKLDATRLMAVLSDVTLEVQREQRALDQAARTDSLTQMPNRAVLCERIDQALQLARSGVAAGPDHADSADSAGFAVLFMNCDRFNLINDNLGHAAGDELLGLVAQRLRSELRTRNRHRPGASSGPLAARNGGDEFVVFLDDLQRPEDALAVANRLLVALDKPYAIGEHQVHCSVSLGLVLQAQAGADADTVLRDARTAMVEARRAGGASPVVFEPAMQERAARRGDLDTDLRRAIAAREFFVVYQPIVNLQSPAGDRAVAKVGAGFCLDDTGCAGPYADDTGCAGVEALVRWQHPVRGLVAPIEFIAAAEEFGLIGAIGEFVLETACQQFAQWQRELGPRAPRLMAVNLSRAQLGQPGLVEFVRATLRSAGMTGAQLQLEVTESLAAQDEVVQAQLRELKTLGMTVALDDFGTGYSSLSSLHALAVDTLKIDRSFVSQADLSHHHHVLIQATILVANSLGMSTVAEGIETEAQAEVVRRLGCHKGQGYLFSRPLLAADIPAWLAAQGGTG